MRSASHTEPMPPTPSSRMSLYGAHARARTLACGVDVASALIIQLGQRVKKVARLNVHRPQQQFLQVRLERCVLRIERCEPLITLVMRQVERLIEQSIELRPLLPIDLQGASSPRLRGLRCASHTVVQGARIDHGPVIGIVLVQREQQSLRL